MSATPEAASVRQALNATLAAALRAAEELTGESISLRVHNSRGALQLYGVTGVELVSLDEESRKTRDSLARFDERRGSGSTQHAPPQGTGATGPSPG